MRDPPPAKASSLNPNGFKATRLNVGEVGPWGIRSPANHSGSGTIRRPGLGGVEDGRKGYCCPPHPGRADWSSQSVFIRGVLAVGELNGGVTGALIEPPWMWRFGSLEEEAEEDPDERFLSHGIRDLPSAF